MTLAGARTERGTVSAVWFRVGPVLTVLAIVLIVWYGAAIWLNAAQVIERVLSDRPGWAFIDLARLTLSMDRPVLPAPHQIALDLFDSVFGWPLDSPRNLLFHAAVTSSATLLGFVMGTALGAVLGDFLDKPVSAGGLALSRYSASAVLLALIVTCIFAFPQRAARKGH